MRSKSQRVLDRLNKMKEDKNPWLPLFELLGEYVMTRKQGFTADTVPGQFLNDKIFDSTAGSAYHLMASTLIGGMWPNGAKSVQIDMPTLLKGTSFETPETKAFYEYATKIMVEKIDHPRAGFITSLEEYMGDDVVFGLAGISAFENDDLDVPVQFSAVDVKRIGVDEGKDGFVDTVYIEKDMTIRQVILEYGYDNVSKAIRDKWDKGVVDERVKILHAIEPRTEKDPYAFGNTGMPVASIHIEVASQKILRESGYAEMPVFVTRFWKVTNEMLGRSPAMEALPDILEINAIREASIIAIEKTLDPPLAIFDDGSLGGGTIDTSAGAINVFSVSGRMGQQAHDPVRPLIEGGELNSTYARITELRESIRNHFFLDRLTDFNSDQRMQNPEVMIRDRDRGQSLGTSYSRQIAELFTPLIDRVFNILLRKGLFGVIKGSKEEHYILANGGTPNYIPDAVASLIMKGQEVYKVNYISPAARVMQSEELAGIEKTVNFALEIGGVDPSVMDNINLDEIMRSVQSLTGAPSRIINDLDTVRKVRDARAKQQAALAKAESEKNQSEVARNMGQAGQSVSQMQGSAA